MPQAQAAVLITEMVQVVTGFLALSVVATIVHGRFYTYVIVAMARDITRLVYLHNGECIYSFGAQWLGRFMSNCKELYTYL